MADKIRVWFDAEVDFLEVRFPGAAGCEKETNHDPLMGAWRTNLGFPE